MQTAIGLTQLNAVDALAVTVLALLPHAAAEGADGTRGGAASAGYSQHAALKTEPMTSQENDAVPAQSANPLHAMVVLTTARQEASYALHHPPYPYNFLQKTKLHIQKPNATNNNFLFLN